MVTLLSLLLALRLFDLWFAGNLGFVWFAWVFGCGVSFGFRCGVVVDLRVCLLFVINYLVCFMVVFLTCGLNLMAVGVCNACCLVVFIG